MSLTATTVAAPSKAHKNPKSDNLKNPMAEKQRALKQVAQERVLKGEAKAVGKNKVVKVANGQFVELAFEGEDQILTVVAEFGEGQHASYPGAPAGPLHNNIPEPDRTIDNTTIWNADFSQDYYNNLLYSKTQVPSMANWYLAQSGGVYSVNGFASDWVTVPYNEARYGRNVCGDIVCTNTWRFVDDSADAWWASLVAQEGSVAGANAYLARFDVWDRYDSDGDGNFDEPDGYIDHFQAVHAGEGEETGGGAQGEDAIWSHRWYAYYPGVGFFGPDGDGPNGFGGIKIGGADGGSNYWIGDYTVEPENGGVGVFAHEFGHDLNLPDLYDTSGNSGGAENGTGWWTNWSQGSYGTIDNQGIGNYPVSATAWERFQLGWLNYGVGQTGKKSSFKLGPVEETTKQLQGVFVVLPDKEITKDLGDPFAGDKFYYSGSGDSLQTEMTREFALPAGTVSLDAKVRYNIESGYDLAYVLVDGNPVDTSLSNSSVLPVGIEGDSGGNWVDLHVDLSAFADGPHTIGFGYFTDGGVAGNDPSLPAGFAVDDLMITGGVTDGAESDTGWVYDSNQDDQGFHVTSGSESFSYFNAYVAEFRQYRSYDKALELGPYNFTDPTGIGGKPNWVEHFPAQDGLLIWYWDSSFADNNVGDHPGGGLLLPVDSHPGILHWSDGSTARPRIQSIDATFGLSRTDPLSLHSTLLTLTSPALPAVSVFNDMNSYWVTGDPGDNGANGRYQSEWNSVKVPHTGTTIRVVNTSAQGTFMQIEVK
ncbi:MAG: immune inhibitor A domain-containing protein [Chloroflexota bacterium]